MEGSRIGGNWTGQVLASRRGAVTVALISAGIAGILIYAFVSHYRKTTVLQPANAVVFVAKGFIPAGTPESSIASQDLLKRELVPATQAVSGAIVDPSEIAGAVSVASITAGQQVTVADFAHTEITIGAYLRGDQRAIAIPLDTAHGFTSYLVEGDTVDIMGYGSHGTVMLAQDITVLANSGGDVVFRVTDKQALVLTAASAETQLWLSLRPPAGARSSVGVGAVGNA